MKIFIVIPEKYAGCGFYRQYQPHRRMMENNEIDVVLSEGVFREDGGLGIDADMVQGIIAGGFGFNNRWNLSEFFSKFCRE